MMKEDFEELIGKRIDDDTYENVVEFIYMSFGMMTKQQIASLFTDEDKSLFNEGHDLAREIKILNKAAAELRMAGLDDADDDLEAFADDKERTYMAKVKERYGIR